MSEGRRKIIGIILLLSFVSFLAETVIAESEISITEVAKVEYNQMIAEIIAEVSKERYEKYLNDLTGEDTVFINGGNFTIKTREADSNNGRKAEEYAYNLFQNLSYEVEYQEFSGQKNVIATLNGTEKTKETYIICAHLDSVEDCPGADDDGSGSAAVMEAAYVMRNHIFKYTVKFVLFMGEEDGLVGSEKYARACRNRNEDIKGVLNLDMVAYEKNGDNLVDVYAYRQVPELLGHIFVNVILLYSIHLKPSLITYWTFQKRSDHRSFWTQGYPAIMIHENEFTPHYHKSSDKISTLNLDYAINVVKANVATLAELASNPKYLSVITKLNLQDIEAMNREGFVIITLCISLIIFFLGGPIAYIKIRDIKDSIKRRRRKPSPFLFKFAR